MTNEKITIRDAEKGNQTPSITINTGTEVVTRELTANELKALSGGDLMEKIVEAILTTHPTDVLRDAAIEKVIETANSVPVPTPTPVIPKGR